MSYLALTCTYLITGVILVPAGSYCIYKIYHGSKSGFAYTLMTFTILEGGINIANFLVYSFPIII